MRNTEVVEEDPLTGGRKGVKPEQMSLVYAPALLALSRVCSKGAAKYDRHNWRKGYRWSLSYDALQRHLLAFWGGQDMDEDGESHLAHAMWHCMVLLCFSEEQREKDDRFESMMCGKLGVPGGSRE